MGGSTAIGWGVRCDGDVLNLVQPCRTVLQWCASSTSRTRLQRQCLWSPYVNSHCPPAACVSTLNPHLNSACLLGLVTAIPIPFVQPDDAVCPAMHCRGCADTPRVVVADQHILIACPSPRLIIHKSSPRVKPLRLSHDAGGQ